MPLSCYSKASRFVRQLLHRSRSEPGKYESKGSPSSSPSPGHTEASTSRASRARPPGHDNETTTDECQKEHARELVGPLDLDGDSPRRIRRKLSASKGTLSLDLEVRTLDAKDIEVLLSPDHPSPQLNGCRESKTNADWPSEPHKTRSTTNGTDVSNGAHDGISQTPPCEVKCDRSDQVNPRTTTSPLLPPPRPDPESSSDMKSDSDFDETHLRTMLRNQLPEVSLSCHPNPVPCHHPAMVLASNPLRECKTPSPHLYYARSPISPKQYLIHQQRRASLQQPILEASRENSFDQGKNTSSTTHSTSNMGASKARENHEYIQEEQRKSPHSYSLLTGGHLHRTRLDGGLLHVTKNLVTLSNTALMIALVPRVGQHY